VRWTLGEERQDHELNVDRVELAAAGEVAASKAAHESGRSTAESASSPMATGIVEVGMKIFEISIVKHVLNYIVRCISPQLLLSVAGPDPAQ
jgi:hypothetical protein